MGRPSVRTDDGLAGRTDMAEHGPILVIEDDGGLRELLSESLVTEGYAVVTAPNGLAALEHISRQAPRLILLDMRMPIMDGWRFADAYRQLPGPHAPIIVVSGTMDAADEAAAIHADSFLDKPFTLDELRDLVNRYLQPG